MFGRKNLTCQNIAHERSFIPKVQHYSVSPLPWLHSTKRGFIITDSFDKTMDKMFVKIFLTIGLLVLRYHVKRLYLVAQMGIVIESRVRCSNTTPAF